MLQPIILDNTERLLANSPYFAAMPRHTIIHADTKTSSSHFYSNSINRVLYNPVLNIFHCIDANSAATLTIAPDNFATGGIVSVVETSTMILGMALEPGNTGRVWGYRKDSGGQDGLWMRSAAGSWSKIIGATNNDTQYIVVKTNGDLWYNNATAGNWYQLQNGAAGGATVTTPSGMPSSRGTEPDAVNASYGTPDALSLQQYNFGSVTFSLYGNSTATTAVDSFSANPTLSPGYSTSNADRMTLWDNNYTSSATFSANAICRIPTETILYAKPPSQDHGGTFTTKIIALNSTYTLLLAQYQRGTDDAAAHLPTNTAYARYPFNDGSPFKTHTRVAMSIVNRSTKVVRFIGCFDIPHLMEISQATAAEDIPGAAINCVGGRLLNGTLGLLSVGKFGVSINPTDVNGAIFTQIPLLKLDF